VDVRLLYDPIEETQAVACKGKVVECASNTGLIETDAGEVRAVRAWAGRSLWSQYDGHVARHDLLASVYSVHGFPQRPQNMPGRAANILAIIFGA
jgi:hypothetical protein